jgi:hypothetical protein
MVNASTRFVLAVVATVTGTTKVLGVALSRFVYLPHRRKQQKQEKEQSKMSSGGNSSKRQSTNETDEVSIVTASIYTNMPKMQQQKQDQGGISAYAKCTLSDENEREIVDASNYSSNPKVQNFSSSTSSLSYVPSPQINNFSLIDTQNSSEDQYSDDNSFDIDMFDDKWSIAMVSKAREVYYNFCQS